MKKIPWHKVWPIVTLTFAIALVSGVAMGNANPPATPTWRIVSGAQGRQLIVGDGTTEHISVVLRHGDQIIENPPGGGVIAVRRESGAVMVIGFLPDVGPFDDSEIIEAYDRRDDGVWIHEPPTPTVLDSRDGWNYETIDERAAPGAWNTHYAFDVDGGRFTLTIAMEQERFADESDLVEVELRDTLRWLNR